MMRTRFGKRWIGASVGVIALASSLLTGATGTAQASSYFMLESNQDIGYCLDGTISAITIQPCNAADEHQFWQETDAYYYPTTGQTGYMLQNEYNGYCIDGTETVIYPNSACDDYVDQHFVWIPQPDGNSVRFQNGYNAYDIDGTLSDVYPNKCTSSDLHCLWFQGTF